MNSMLGISAKFAYNDQVNRVSPVAFLKAPCLHIDTAMREFRTILLQSFTTLGARMFRSSV